jgi:L-ascorbate metabolism protein UlaG (beta-lactamase superfamily)
MIEPLLSDDAFLADVEEARPDSRTVHLWWLGQSGFLVKWNSGRLLIDPYLSDSLTEKYHGTARPHVRMSRRVVDPARLEKISIITVSHQHGDHLDEATLKAIRTADLNRQEPWNPMLVAPRAIRHIAQQRWGADVEVCLNDLETYGWADFSILTVAAAHDRIERNERGWSNYLGYVFRFGSICIYHSGDTVLYDGLIEQLRPLGVTLAILPINGKLHNMNGADAARLAKGIGAKLVLPCHYAMFEFNTADPNDKFSRECEKIGQTYRIPALGERLTIRDA